MNTESILYLTDSYKITHWAHYPPGTQHIYSYLESRGGLFPRTVFFGLQYFLKEYLAAPQLTLDNLTEAREFWRDHFGQDLLNYEGWYHIWREHKGRLPVSIKAVPEGAVIDTKNVLVTIENTDPQVPWLTNVLETLLVEVWYPITVATLAREIKKVILQYHHKTGSDTSEVDFKLHDFGFRGVSSVESAGLGGAAHLVSFKGTDTPRGIRMAMKYYGADVCGFSIPATEHSVMTIRGRNGEAEVVDQVLAAHPTGMAAIVGDSYNIFEFINTILAERKEKILNREGRLVVRPDSGDPPTIVGQVLDLLGEAFGYRTNQRGFKVLSPKVRVIQGDGIDYTMIRQILSVMELKGWAAENVAFGMGGALLQRLDRDTQKFAFKCSAAVVGGRDVDVFKDPVTDPGKTSKKGRLKLIQTRGAHGPVYETVNPSEEGEDQLVEVFRNGEILREYSFDEIRARAASTYTV